MLAELYGSFEDLSFLKPSVACVVSVNGFEIGPHQIRVWFNSNHVELVSLSWSTQKTNEILIAEHLASMPISPNRTGVHHTTSAHDTLGAI